jgi:predicted membrane protein (TIGR00267 family)
VTEPEDDQLKDPGIIERTMRALELTQGVEIARRYLAMNAFDGALTMLGLIFGGLITMQTTNPEVVFDALLLAAVGTSVAMAVSGFSGSYLAESAERDREVEEIGKAMLSDMSNSMYAKATRTTSAVVALVDGLAPSVAAFIIISPLLLVPSGILSVSVAFYIAIFLCMGLLFALGLFLGTISRKNIWAYGAKTLLAGIITAILLYIIASFTGAA